MVSYRTIVVGTDLSSMSDLAVDAALAVAARTGAQRLHLVHVAPVSPNYLATGYAAALPLSDAVIEPVLKRAVDDAKKRLDELPIHSPPASVNVTREARLGIPARELGQLAQEISADLIVIASRRRGGLARLVLGSVADALIRTAHCGVLIVGEQRPGTDPMEHVLASVDLSPVSEQVIEHAIAMAKGSAGRVRVVSLFELPVVSALAEPLPAYLTPAEAAEMAAHHERAVRKLVEEAAPQETPVDIEVRTGNPIDEVLDTADRMPADLVVVGTSGHNAWQRMLLGSTANKVVAHASCPVLVVPHGAVAPHGAAPQGPTKS